MTGLSYGLLFSPILLHGIDSFLINFLNSSGSQVSDSKSSPSFVSTWVITFLFLFIPLFLKFFHLYKPIEMLTTFSFLFLYRSLLYSISFLFLFKLFSINYSFPNIIFLLNSRFTPFISLIFNLIRYTGFLI